ncbi:MAG TPA: aspartate--ammonia ligase [Bacteroidales bacterium]|nr:aspartate--ammonia ligase [Bacteroidales bacterium]HPS17205.1 aspartate--ammonia ligase [Bacteroidales bacterium]
MKYKEILKTEEAIALVKETFARELSKQLNLIKISSPLVVLDGTGINDDLNGVEKPVMFDIKNISKQKAVVVQSLAKWKRLRLKQLEIDVNEGILTDMRALRPDEVCSSLHSIYVDQWDWELHIGQQQRTLSFLKKTVCKIYEALKETEKIVHHYDTKIPVLLPEKIKFLHAEELLQLYPTLSVKERETEVAKEYGAVFIIGIGSELSNGEPHDGRAPDYDDWSTMNEEEFVGLNGDIIVWHPVLQCAFELSSMGIRVDKHALVCQLKERKCTERARLPFHKMLLDDTLPQSIGGGIGQSRVCMFMLKKSHIGEVQVSIWPEDEKRKLTEAGVCLM